MRLYTKAASALAAVVLTALPVWAKVNTDNLANLCDAGKQNACRELAKIAEQDKDATVRIQVIRRLRDQTVLARVAMEDHDSDARSAAVERLTDQTVLARVAVTDKDSDVCVAAIEKVTDQPLLATIALEGKNASVRSTAVEKVADQPLLAKIALESMDASVRNTAMEKLTDQLLLAKIALEGRDTTVRSAAVGRLTDQPLLAKIAEECTDTSIRSAAAGRLTDQPLLAKIAVEGADSRIRSIALGRLTDQPLVAKIAVEDTDTSIRSAALEKLTDQYVAADDRPEDSVLLRLLAGESDKPTRDPKQAIARIKLAIQEPPISSRLPGLRSVVTVAKTSKSYEAQERVGNCIGNCGGMPINGHVEGEDITIRLEQGEAVIAKDEWYTDFSKLKTIWPSFYPDPKNVDLGSRGANVVGEHLLRKLLGRNAFTQEDLVETSHSSIPEVSIAATANLRDRALRPEDSAKALMPVAGDTRAVTRDAKQAIARIKLAIQEPRVMARLPGLRCGVDVTHPSRCYSRFGYGPTGCYNLSGEDVTVWLEHCGIIFAYTKWSTVFPDAWSEGSSDFLGAIAYGEDLLEILFGLGIYDGALVSPAGHTGWGFFGGTFRFGPRSLQDITIDQSWPQSARIFTQEDLAQLAYSSIPEVRVAVAANLTDRAALTKLAKDRVSDVRNAAVRRLNDLGSQP